MNIKYLTLFALLSLLPQPVFASSAIKIDNVIVMAQPDGRNSAALIMDIINSGQQDDVLLSIDAPVARFTKPHITSSKDSSIKMRTRDEIAIPAESTVVLEDDGLHVMLLGLKRPLKPGKSLLITFNFKYQGAVQVEASVKIMKHGH